MVRNKPFSVVSGTKFGICCQLEFIGVFLCVNQQKRCNTRFWQRKESDSHWADVWNTTKWKHITGCTTHLGGCKSCQPVTVETWNVRACSVLLSLSRWRSSHVKYADWIYECQILFLLILRRVESDYCLQWMRWNDLGGEDNLDSGKFLGFSINAFIAINSFLAHINDRQQTRAQIRVILWKYHAVLDKFREKAHILVLMIVLSESAECGGYTEVIAERVWRMRGAHRSMECSWPRTAWGVWIFLKYFADSGRIWRRGRLSHGNTEKSWFAPNVWLVAHESNSARNVPSAHILYFTIRSEANLRSTIFEYFFFVNTSTTRVHRKKKNANKIPLIHFQTHYLHTWWSDCVSRSYSWYLLSYLKTLMSHIWPWHCHQIENSLEAAGHRTVWTSAKRRL